MNKNDTKLSLNHGNFFKKLSKTKPFQKGKKIEKFTTSIPFNLKDETIKEKQDKLNDLENHLILLRAEYEELITNIYEKSQEYLDRIDPSNLYLNKFIRFDSGELFYVTSMGVAKFVPDLESLTNTGVTYNQSQVIDINVTLPDNYTIYGNAINTSPPLITGTPVVPDKLLIDTNTNVLANKMINNENSTFEGCYSNSPTPMSVPEINRMSLDECKDFAIANAYKYYGLKNTSDDDLKGTCALSNDDNVLNNNIGDNCELIGSNNYGGINTIAAYKMEEVGIPNFYDKYGYIDSNAILHKYRKNKFNPPPGVPTNINNIDTIKFGNYKLGSILRNKKYGNYISKKDQKRLNYLNNEINKVTRQINDISIELRLNNQWINNKINNNNRLATSAITEINSSANQINNIKSERPKYKYMREDSDINILQKNYTFILFSILATTSLIIAINLMNK
jgi:hypothetical protein